MITHIDKEGRDFIYREEGCRIKSYFDSVGVPTIGVGFTFYPGGKKVKMGDVISLTRCDEIFATIIKSFENAVATSVQVELNQHQFNALVSFSYNVGIGTASKGFLGSTLLKKINAGASEDDIRAEFAKWNIACGKVNKVLSARRQREADLYFKPTT